VKLPVSASHGGNRCDETITPSCFIDDVPTRTAAVAQHLFQGMQMDAQRDFLNENIGPSPGDQLVSAHNVAGPLNQGGKNGKRPATDPDGNSIVRQ
jgi:hypothetical protein